jgi:thymidylate synthase ThyX
MNFTVTGLTVEQEGITKEQLEASKIFSGKNAGICYMGDSYFDSAVTDPDKALKRFISTANNAHHSIADHVRVEVLFEGISKMLAIILNSLQDYATSEKSGRYTVMTGNSERETQLYDKWLKLFKKRIIELEPNIDDEMLTKQMAKKGHDDVIIENGQLANGNMSDDDEVHKSVLFDLKHTLTTLPSTKMAQENASYVLSVFTYSTTMGYSTSLRQWNYIYDWCIKYMNQYDVVDENKVVYKSSNSQVTYFEEKLYFDFSALSNFIHENLYIEELRDTKDRCFEFLTNYSGNNNHPMALYNFSEFEPNGYTNEFDYTEDATSPDDKLDLTYNVAYTASFVHIAQAERHRTLKYFMVENFSSKLSDFFVPPMIKNTDLESEWLQDLKSVEDLIPQARKIGIVETGHISDFILKCEERLCGRAQWEIMHQTKLTAKRFIKAAEDSENRAFCAYVEKLHKSGVVKTKCQLIGCKEGCRYGASGALKRLI